MCLYAATFCALLRLDRRPAWSSYVLLGLTLGIGALSRHTYGVFAASLLFACLFDVRFRAAILTPKILLAVLIAIIVVLPHFVWAVANIEDFLSIMRGKLELDGPAGGPDARLVGLWDLVQATIGFLLPLWVLLLLLFPAALKGSPEPTGSGARYRKVLGIHLLVLIAIFVALILVFGITRIRTQYMYVLILFPLFALSRIEGCGAKDVALKIYAGLITILASSVVIGMFAKLYLEPIRCDTCPFHLKYADLAGSLRESGFAGGSILGYWHPYAVAGNLKMQFPDSRVLSVKHPQYRPPDRPEAGQCLIIWPRGPESWRRTAMISNANTYLGTNLATDTTADVAAVPLFMSRDRSIEFAYILLDPGESGCHLP